MLIPESLQVKAGPAGFYALIPQGLNQHSTHPNREHCAPHKFTITEIDDRIHFLRIH